MITTIENKIYYVYEYINLTTNEPFYVGKGKGSRMFRTYGRSKEFDYIFNFNNCAVSILEDKLSEKEALEYEVYYIYEYQKLGFELTNKQDGGKSHGLIGEGNAMFNRPWWDENTPVEKIEEWKKRLSRPGEKNGQYGVSPKDRMDTETYKRWYDKRAERMKGSTNPNYGNTTLKKFYKDHPEEKMKLARKGSQNGTSREIELYDIDRILIKGFSYIGEMCEYMIKNNMSNSKINSIRNSVRECIKGDKPYKKKYFFKYK